MAGSKFFNRAFGAFKKPKAKAHSKQPVVRCSGTPPSTLSEQFVTNYDRTFNFDSHDEREFDQISDDEACSNDDAYDNDVSQDQLPSHCSTPTQTSTRRHTKRKLGKASRKTVASTSEHARKKELYQTPPSDDESSDYESSDSETDDDESDDGSDDWTAIYLDSNGDPCEKPASKCQKSGSASGGAKACQLRINPAFAAKHGDFFNLKSQNSTLTAR